MTPEQFVAKWKGSQLGERQASQEQFIDLCRLLDEKTPAEADATGENYCFERGAAKMDGGDGWADVWKRGHFAWEYKGKHKDLDEAYRQLQQYRDDLENPPLLVVSDMERFIVRTNWTNTVQRRMSSPSTISEVRGAGHLQAAICAVAARKKSSRVPRLQQVPMIQLVRGSTIVWVELWLIEIVAYLARWR